MMIGIVLVELGVELIVMITGILRTVVVVVMLLVVVVVVVIVVVVMTVLVVWCLCWDCNGKGWRDAVCGGESLVVMVSRIMIGCSNGH